MKWSKTMRELPALEKTAKSPKRVKKPKKEVDYRIVLKKNATLMPSSVLQSLMN